MKRGNNFGVLTAALLLALAALIPGRASAISGPAVTSFTATPTEGVVPLSVSFQVTASDPAGGAIVKTLWDFDGDDVTAETTTDNRTVTHLYDKTGTYLVKATVVNGRGETGQSVVRVEVVDGPQVSLQVLASGTRAPGVAYADLEIGNIGTAEASNVRIESVSGKTADGATLGQNLSYSPVYPLPGEVVDPASLEPTSLPIQLGRIRPGERTRVRYCFDVPQGVTSFLVTQTGFVYDADGKARGYTSSPVSVILSP
ncbi:MAG TPA: PKD domain-containing protein [Candidatus Deferrimicrobiaceae bacterium]